MSPAFQNAARTVRAIGKFRDLSIRMASMTTATPAALSVAPVPRLYCSGITSTIGGAVGSGSGIPIGEEVQVSPASTSNAHETKYPFIAQDESIVGLDCDEDVRLLAICIWCNRW